MELTSLLSNYFCDKNNIDLNRTYVVEEIEAKKLIVKERIDLIAKIKYIEYREKGYDLAFIKELYQAHIEAFSLGKFEEPGNPFKKNIEDYFNEFDRMIDSIKIYGLDKNISLIPVGDNNVILDGSHRVAIAAYFNLKVPIIRFENLKSSYDSYYFRKRLLDEVYIDFLVSEFSKYKNNIYVACIWPKSKDSKKRKEMESVFHSSTNVIYHKNIKLNYDGLHNLITQIYSEQSWIGDIDDKFEGAKNKRDACYDLNEKITLYVFQSNEFEEVLILKENIRKIFNIDNHSIHITDTKEEVKQLVNLLLNENSISFLNEGKPFQYKSIYSLITNFKNKILMNRLELEEFIVDSSSTMAMYGLRNAEDLDYLTLSKNWQIVEDNDIQNHYEYLRFYNENLESLVLDPRNYFTYYDVKFVNLKILREFKINRGEIKDQLDVKLIENVNKEKSKLTLNLLKLESGLKRKIRNYKLSIRKHIVSTLKAIGLYRLVKSIYNSSKE